MDATETYLCHPTGPKIQLPANFLLSPCDQMMPKIHVPFTAFYALPDSSPALRRAIVDKLKSGLEKLASQVPSLAGKITIDPKTQRVSLDYLGDEDGINFLAVGVGTVRTDLPSYATFEAGKFVPWLLPEGSTYPESLINPPGSNSGHAQRLPASIFQLTFIDGGLILTAAMHHSVFDGPSVDLVFRAWVAHCHGSTIPLLTDRGFFSAPDKPSDSQLQTLKVTLSSRGCAIESTKPDPDNPWSSVSIDPVKATIIVFSPIAVGKLKNSINQSQTDVRVSTADCVQALIWTGLVRANMASRREACGQRESTSILPISFRSRRIPVFPTNLIGNSFTVHGVKLPVFRLVEGDGPAQAAIASRKSIEGVDAAYYTSALSWSSGLASKPTTRTWLCNPLRKLDVGFTSWAGMTTYQSWDFGFGCPQALRPPLSPIPYVVLLPAKKLPNADHASMEALIGTSDATLTALLKDDDFLHYVADNQVNLNV